MIRIDVIAQTQKQVVLKVQGELADDDVDLLAGELCRWRVQVEQLVLDLKGVKFIDRQGLALLQQWARREPIRGNGVGVRLLLRDGSRFIRHLLEANGLEVY
jgi:anti-anti-sigma factor